VALAYERVGDLGEALAVLGELGPSAVPLAGGTDLMPTIREGKITDTTLVDISRADELRTVEATTDHVRIGSLVTAAELARSSDMAEILPVVTAAARTLGSPQIRARATIGGNVVNGSPAADMALALVVAGAEVETATAGGVRSLPMEDFVSGPGLTRLAPGELVTAFKASVRAGARYGYAKVGLRRALACALVNVGVMVVPSADGARCAEARIVLGAVAPTCIRAREAEELLVGGEIDESIVDRVAEAASAECAPIDDVRASATYRRYLVGVHVSRLLTTLLGGDIRGGG
jgi:CO/xanthine dehydrogenase FAD-binding subunit